MFVTDWIRDHGDVELSIILRREGALVTKQKTRPSDLCLCTLIFHPDFIFSKENVLRSLQIDGAICHD